MNLGQIVRMWTYRTAAGQSLTSWCCVNLALWLWANWYRMITPERSIASRAGRVRGMFSASLWPARSIALTFGSQSRNPHAMSAVTPGGLRLRSCLSSRRASTIAAASTSTAPIGTNVFGQTKSSQTNPLGSDSARVVHLQPEAQQGVRHEMVMQGLIAAQRLQRRVALGVPSFIGLPPCLRCLVPIVFPICYVPREFPIALITEVAHRVPKIYRPSMFVLHGFLGNPRRDLFCDSEGGTQRELRLPVLAIQSKA